MGFEANETPPSPSPLDRSNAGSLYGDRGRHGFPVGFNDMSRKKWTVLALSVGLIIVLLIAIIILAARSNHQEVPPCAKANATKTSRIGGNDALQGGPITEESKMRGVPIQDEDAANDDYDEDLTSPAAKTTSSTAKTTTKKGSNWWDDAPQESFVEVLEEAATTRRTTTTTTSTSTSSTTTSSSSSTSTLRKGSIFNDPVGDLKFQTMTTRSSNQIDPRGVARSDADVQIVAELMTLTRTLSEKEAVEKIIAKYGLSREELDANLSIVHDVLTNHTSDENQILTAAAREWSNPKPRALASSRDLHTEDDGHVHDMFDDDDFGAMSARELAPLSEDEREAEKSKNFTYGVVQRYLDYDGEFFSSPADVGTAENETVAVLGNRVASIRDVLDEIKDENTNEDAEKAINEYLSFLETLRADISMLNSSQFDSDANLILNKTTIQLVNRLYYDYVTKSKTPGYAEIRQEVKGFGGMNDANSTLTEKAMNDLRRQSIQQNILSQDTGVLGRGVLERMVCNANTELACDDGKGCYDFTKRCDRWIDCAFDKSDEKNCPCRDYIDKSRICDGYPDCEDGVDELGCDCSTSEHNCGFQKLDGKLHPAPQCIDNTLRCDNVIDCPASSNDESNCLTLSPTALGNEVKFPRQAIQGMLHVQRSQAWKVLAIDVVGDDYSSYKKLLSELSFEVCQSTITKGQNTPTVNLVDIEDPSLDVAHLTTNLNASTSRIDRFYESSGRFYFTIKPRFEKTTKAVWIDCGPAKCGQAVNDGNDPFAIFMQGHNYERPAPQSGLADVRVIGGVDSRPTKWPFALSLNVNGAFKCGASIIADRWVLTAAHCVYNFSDTRVFQVRGGIYRQKSNAVSEVIRTLTEIYIHPDYIAETLDNDIALAKVDRAFPKDSFTAQICLPSVIGGDIRSLPREGDNCFAIGWGRTVDENGPVADTLQEVDVPIKARCANKFSNNSNQVCGGYDEGGKDTCSGDSGGPLFCQNMKSSVESWYLGGIVSHGIGCAQPLNPGVYTRVSFYQDWIDTIIRGMAIGRTGVPKASTSCPSGVVCDKGTCVPKSALCNHYVDCYDGLDEKYCKASVENGKVVYTFIGGTYGPPPATTTTPRPTTTTPYHPYGTSLHTMSHHPHHDQECSSGSFICKNVRQCFDVKKRCNMMEDCVDGSDERGCTCRDYFATLNPGKICDGYPDCYDFSDELGCQRCPNPSAFYCHVSKKCIGREQVCDEKFDCTFHEDEQYCAALVKNDKMILDVNNKPTDNVWGYIALNAKGSWRLVCAQQWNDQLSNRICQYLGFRGAANFTLFPATIYPTMVSNDLPVQWAPNRIWKRSLDSTAMVKYQPHDVAKRSTTTCSFIETVCINSKSCGTLPLYSGMAREDIPTFGEGVAPWLVQVYVDGVYKCGGTLVSPRWVLTHGACAREVSLDKFNIARLGMYWNVEPKFLSAREQVVRIALSVQVPNSDIALLKLEKNVNLTDHVSTACLPSTEWIPVDSNCFIHGTHGKAFNHAIETRVKSKCNINGNSYDLCTKQTKPSGECLNNWSGSLVCPDSSGNFYALGVYHTGPVNCAANPGSNIPEEFVSVVSDSARDNIRSVIRANIGEVQPLGDTTCRKEDGMLRCPLGACLPPSKLCDGKVDCQDGSDENEKFCQEKIRMCEQVSATHCQCLLDDMMCDNLMCLHKSRFCDGVNDCGDNSDEPANCKNDCSLSLAAFNETLLCDAKIDCLGDNDFGRDESVERCCTAENTVNNYKCVLGQHPSPIAISDQCIPRDCVCDWDVDPATCPSCVNGADEIDCVSINTGKDYSGSPSKKPALPDVDAFGRSKSQSEGFVYFTAHGKDFLYCASPKIFTSNRLTAIGKALCQYEGFGGLISISLTKPFKRTRINPGLELSAGELMEFNDCQTIYLSCKVH